MTYTFRPALPEDEPFLWEMLYYAAHMDEDAGESVSDASNNPALRPYVNGWGRETDVGVIAVSNERAIGAAWVRLLIGSDRRIAYLDDNTPELAVAVHPSHIGNGVGTALVRAVLDAARETFPAVVLSVRVENPAKRLYEHLGFQIVREAVNRVGGKSYVMRMSLR